MRTLLFFALMLTYFVLQPRYDLPEFSTEMKFVTGLTVFVVAISDLAIAERRFK